MKLHGCIYELASGERCEGPRVHHRHLCAKHIVAKCGCGRQAVRESPLSRTPFCTRCSQRRGREVA